MINPCQTIRKYFGLKYCYKKNLKKYFKHLKTNLIVVKNEKSINLGFSNDWTLYVPDNFFLIRFT